MDLVYAKADKTLDENGWILNTEYLTKIKEDMDKVGYFVDFDIEDIETILLVANGESHLLQNTNQ